MTKEARPVDVSSPVYDRSSGETTPFAGSWREGAGGGRTLESDTILPAGDRHPHRARLQTSLLFDKP
jgi:hypothetical protein